MAIGDNGDIRVGAGNDVQQVNKSEVTPFWTWASTEESAGVFGFPTPWSPGENDITMMGKKEDAIDSLQQNYNANFNVTKTKFEGTAADLDSYLKNTPMKGMGAALLQAQEKYGVNALFLMTIMSAESGYGAAPARDSQGQKKYNAAGLKKKGGGYQEPKSFADCIDRLGSNLSRLYFPAKVTVEKIRQTFCPGNKSWTPEVVKEMKNIAAALLKRYM